MAKLRNRTTVTDADLMGIERAWLALVRRSTQPRMHADILDQAGVALDRSSYPILALLDDHGPQSMTALADAIGLDLSTISRQVVRLERQGFIGRKSTKGDARVRVVSMTARGLEAMERIREARHQMLAQLLSHLSKTDIKTLNKALTQLVVALSV